LVSSCHVADPLPQDGKLFMLFGDGDQQPVSKADSVAYTIGRA
jgi:hypothetical protein